MNPPIRMSLPKGSNLRLKIVDTYTSLYNQFRRSYPRSTSYPVSQLNMNIRNGYSIVRQSFPHSSFKLSQYAPWAIYGWYEVYYSHWYFAVTFVRNKKGIVRAVIQDAIYEGYHHNDVMTTKPYESKTYKKSVILTGSNLKNIIAESVSRVLSEYYNEDYLPEVVKVRKRENKTKGRQGNANSRIIGNYEVIETPSLDCKAESLKQFGWYEHILMYYSQKHTYCLLRRCKNGMYFFAEIVDAPELGNKETKFNPLVPKDVPAIILRDAQNYIHRENANLLHGLLLQLKRGRISSS